MDVVDSFPQHRTDRIRRTSRLVTIGAASTGASTCGRPRSKLTQQLLCDPETAPVAHRQQERYLSTVRDALVRIADITDVRWPTPLPVLTRMTMAFVDGLTHEWVVDRDSRHTRQALRAFGAALQTFAAPIG